MEASIWSASLAGFRERVAGTDPVPAGVAVSAVTASLALALLAKVLAIAGGRKNGSAAPVRDSSTQIRPMRSRGSRRRDLVAPRGFFASIRRCFEPLVGRVRRKVDRPGLVPLVHTVRGAGYAITDRARTAPNGA